MCSAVWREPNSLCRHRAQAISYSLNFRFKDLGVWSLGVSFDFSQDLPCWLSASVQGFSLFHTIYRMKRVPKHSRVFQHIAKFSMGIASHGPYLLRNFAFRFLLHEGPYLHPELLFLKVRERGVWSLRVSTVRRNFPADHLQIKDFPAYSHVFGP